MTQYEQLANAREWNALVKETERRNRAVALRHNTGDQKTDAGYHKVRLLKIVDNCWIVERPQIRDKKPNFHTGDKIVGIIGPSAKRWGFHSRVLAVQLFQVNETSRIPTLTLAPPTNMHCAQRRAYYRVTTLTSDVSEVAVHPLLELDSVSSVEDRIMDIHKNARADAAVSDLPVPKVDKSFKAQMFDLSGNGVSLLVNPALLEVMKLHALYWLKFTLPDSPIPLGVVASRVRAGTNLQYGHVAAMQFQFNHNPDYGRFISDQVCRFAAEEQRRQLQRVR